jgi:hypothetical protein
MYNKKEHMPSREGLFLLCTKIGAAKLKIAARMDVRQWKIAGRMDLR